MQVTPYESYVRLAERMNEVTPGKFPKKTIFVNTGAEAVENAVKIARAYTKRPGIIAFEDAFHGRTMMTLALTSKTHPYKAGFAPFPERGLSGSVRLLLSLFLLAEISVMRVCTVRGISKTRSSAWLRTKKLRQSSLSRC